MRRTLTGPEGTGVVGLSATKQRLLASLTENPGLDSAPSSDLAVQMTAPRSPTSTTSMLVHPVGGAIFCYAALARAFGPAHSVWGLPGDLHLIRQTADGGTKALAQAYLARLAIAHDSGPLLLAGWSFGGLLAWEMAHQLQQQDPDRDVKVLLLDVAYPPEPEPPPSAAELFDWFVSDMLQQQTSDSGPETGGHSRSDLAELERRTGIAQATLAEYHEMFCINTVSFLAHQPTRSTLSGWAIRAAASYPVDWQALTKGTIETIDVPGDHYSFLNADDTARQIRRLASTGSPYGAAS